MATRTAPTVNGTPTYIRVGISFVDFTGDKASVSVIARADVSDAQIEELVDALQAPSNASIYEVRVESIYTSIASTANADNSVHDSVYQNVVFLGKNGAQSANLYLPAPENDVMTDGTTDNPAWSNTQLQDIRVAWVDVMGAGWAVASMRYTERKEINNKVLPS